MQEFSLLLMQYATTGNLLLSIPLQQHYVLGKVSLAYSHRSWQIYRLQAKSWVMMWTSNSTLVARCVSSGNILQPSFLS